MSRNVVIDLEPSVRLETRTLTPYPQVNTKRTADGVCLLLW